MKRARRYRRKLPDGYSSQLEIRRHRYLRILEMSGEISRLELKPRQVVLVQGFTYDPDFYYYENGVHVWEDVKGDPRGCRGRWPTVKKVWRFYGPPGAILREVKEQRGRWVTTKEILATPEA